ncbi:BatA domain-containing protein [Rubinisphaera sp. JC750]|uniref:BatA domain-containing protein n=1 Tax=Rubinisphaera sp. JC750 TaxID=2898658 RepID=UPI001F34BCA2|nr:BatA domain-containing protein [Rubinisphaera sp. JC750]
MSLLHPGLLYGLILAAVPLVLHFLMRARPKRYDFPALRLLADIRKPNVQRLRLRHLGLLLLRVLAIAFLVFAVTRPTLPSANYGLTTVELITALAAIAAIVGAYFTAKRFWVSRAAGNGQQLLRQAWLRTGSIAALILLLLLLVGWPYQQRLRGEIQDPGRAVQLNVPVAAVFLFDVSPSMGYRHANQSRIEEAFSLAQSQARALPSGSKIAVADNHESLPFNFLSDLTSAETRLQRTETAQPKPITISLNERLLTAISLQQNDREEIQQSFGGDGESDQFLREIYIFTDRTRAAWDVDNAERLRAQLETVPWLNCYIIDVSPEQIVNYALSNLELPRQELVQGQLARITATVSNDSSAPLESLVSLYFEDAVGSETKRDQQTISIPAGDSTQVTFTFPAEQLGPIQGELRIEQSDPLQVDNNLPFSIQVNARPLIYLVREDEQEAFVWQQALAPAPLVERQAHQYDIEQISPYDLAGKLASVDQPGRRTPAVIYLQNVERLTPAAWSALRAYVANGGGLGVFWGNSRVEAENYRNSGQADWLAALPTVHSRSEPVTTLTIQQDRHPIFQYLARVDALGLFSNAGVRRYWKADIPGDSDVLARFQGGEQSPAIVARRHGRGQSVTIHTGVDLKGAAAQNNWSELARLGWVYTAFADQLTRFLAAGQPRLVNRPAGDTVIVSLPGEEAADQTLLQLPGLKQRQISLPYRGPFLSVSRAEESAADLQGNVEEGRLGATELGNYRIGNVERPAVGFSIHLPDNETNMIPISDADLDSLLGEGRWRLSRSYEQLERSLSLARLGQEAYPLLVTILLAIFVGEHLVANFFYGRSST